MLECFDYAYYAFILSRVVLNALGVDDFGLYSVVGGLLRCLLLYRIL